MDHAIFLLRFVVTRQPQKCQRATVQQIRPGAAQLALLAPGYRFTGVENHPPMQLTAGGREEERYPLMMGIQKKQEGIIPHPVAPAIDLLDRVTRESQNKIPHLRISP